MKILNIAIAIVLASFVASCTSAQTDNFVASISNFNRGVAAVDDAVAKLSATLYANCKSIQSVAQSAVDIAGTCSKASPVVTGANAIINSYCQAAQVTNIASAVQATAATISSTKSQLAAAKQSCGS